MTHHTYPLVLVLWLIFMLNCSQTDSDTRFIGGYVDGPKQLTLHFSDKPGAVLKPGSLHILDQDTNRIVVKKVSRDTIPASLTVELEEAVNIKNEYFAEVQGIRKRLIMRRIFQDPIYFDWNAKLGATYSVSGTTFRLFAPRTTALTVNLYELPVLTANEEKQSFTMQEEKGGVWAVTVPDNWAGYYYTFQLESVALDCRRDLEIVDPYAKVVTRGDGQSLRQRDGFLQTIGRGMIVNPGVTGYAEPAPNDNFQIQDAIIYETHVRDFTRDLNSGVTSWKKGLFLGAAEPGTRYDGLKTGLDHVAELGVTVVQLHPVAEFWVGDENRYKFQYTGFTQPEGEIPEREYYNWGYAPINYFSPEGWFATNPDDASRIQEMKQLVSAFHKKGLRVTLDVVFNHTFEGSREHFAHWLFRGIDTDYYYRSFPNGDFCDGIFCGNELNTENPMVAKYIIDCLKYWVTEYQVDGFRFDWMSALDPATMNRMIRELRAINPNLLIYGELWTLRNLSYSGRDNGTYVDRQHIGLFETDYDLPPGALAGFNDYFRDGVKGSGFERDYSGGYIQNVTTEEYYHHTPAELLRQVVGGMVDFTPKSADETEWQQLRSPLSSLNYIACHDGYTLYDKLVLAAWCGYAAPGPEAPKPNYPRSYDNPAVVDFLDSKQFVDPDMATILKKQDLLGAAILFTSQGIPFVHSGQELLRQKVKCVADGESPTGKRYEFDVNSNTSPDQTNAIQWALKSKNADVFHYYQGLIQLRKNHPTFRRTTAASVREGLNFHDDLLPETAETCLAWGLHDPDEKIDGEIWRDVLVFLNPTPEEQKFILPKGEWTIVVNGKQAGIEPLATAAGSVSVSGISAIVLHQ
ncbi:hypothetical protein KAH55_06980 [bacterium]|nr:hypothetical protein [bacterium]